MRSPIKAINAACFVAIFAAHGFAAAHSLRPCLQKLTAGDTTCRVWIIFSDKDAQQPAPALAVRALKRRSHANFPADQSADLPVSSRYIKAIEALGGTRRATFSWANAASFTIRASALGELIKLRFVEDILPVRTMTAALPRTHSPHATKTSALFDTTSAYGFSGFEMRIPAIPPAHDYLVNTLKKVPGDGVLIGMFDSGFRLKHRCFEYLVSHNSVIADSNFVDNNGTVEDPDTLRQAFRNAGVSPPEEHGSWTLSLIGGYDPGKFIGAAWGARFVLAKTEWVGKIINGKEVDIEIHGEEDNWAAAVVWAEQRGVDIVSSSLAYSAGFTDSLGNPRPQDDYTFASMNGSTTIISLAAAEAAKRGMLIVNSAGNEGPDSGTINAPGDVEDVVTVGAVASDKSLAYSSSRGPTADGRIKPDLAAPGTVMYLPSIYSAGDSAYDIGESGTSFAAPLVAGICAMITQTHPTYDAAAVRRCLYASCAFAPRQKSVDNGYGRGIPNALVACRWADTQKTAVLDIALYPTTIFTAGNKQKLTLTLTGLPDNPPGNSQPLTVTIMSVDGKVLWSRSDHVIQNAQLSWGKNFWPQTGALHPPGMYYCAVRCAGKTVIKKFIIAG